MVSPFRQPVEEAAFNLADVDRLIATHRNLGLFLSTDQGRILRLGQSAPALVSTLLHHARFGFLVREAAAANPALSADTAIAAAEDRLHRER